MKRSTSFPVFVFSLWILLGGAASHGVDESSSGCGPRLALKNVLTVPVGSAMQVLKTEWRKLAWKSAMNSKTDEYVQDFQQRMRRPELDALFLIGRYLHNAQNPSLAVKEFLEFSDRVSFPAGSTYESALAAFLVERDTGLSESEARQRLEKLPWEIFSSVPPDI